jgi:hypothetical protein
VGRWPSPAGCFHLASPWLASSSRRSTLAPPSASPSKTRWASRGPSSTAANRRGLQAPLMEFSQRPSLRRSHCVRPLPANRGSRLPPLEHVPSLPFLPASTVFSVHSIAGLLHPAADHGIRLVSRRPPTVADARPSSQALHPSELSPLQQRLSLSPRNTPRHQGPYPLVVRGFIPGNAFARRPQGFLHRRVRCSHSVLPPRSCSLLPWAFPLNSGFRRATGLLL